MYAVQLRFSCIAHALDAFDEKLKFQHVFLCLYSLLINRHLIKHLQERGIQVSTWRVRFRYRFACSVFKIYLYMYAHYILLPN